jgi:hypothetical protein
MRRLRTLTFGALLDDHAITSVRFSIAAAVEHANTP